MLKKPLLRLHGEGSPKDVEESRRARAGSARPPEPSAGIHFGITSAGMQVHRGFYVGTSPKVGLFGEASPLPMEHEDLSQCESYGPPTTVYTVVDGPL